MGEFKVGQKIELTEEARNLLPLLQQKVWESQLAFGLATSMYSLARQEMFDAIRKCHPELDDYEFALRHKEQDIIVRSAGRLD